MKHSTLTSMKFIRLKRRLGIPSYQAAGVLEMLWAFTATNAKDGAIGRFSDEDIAAFLEWEGDPSSLIQILVDSGWIDRREDYRLVIHDWEDHCPNWIKGNLARHKKPFLKKPTEQPTKEPTEQPTKEPTEQPTKEPTVSRLLPNLTQSDPTQPNETIKADTFCPETEKPSSGLPPAPLEKAILTYPTRGKLKKTWSLTQSQIDQWVDLFPHLDILSECRKALAWVKATPKRQKTHGGMCKFLVDWFCRAIDRPFSRSPIASNQKPDLFQEASDRVRSGGAASPVMADLFAKRRQENRGSL